MTKKQRLAYVLKLIWNLIEETMKILVMAVGLLLVFVSAPLWVPIHAICSLVHWVEKTNEERERQERQAQWEKERNED